MLPAVTQTQAKCKTSEKTIRKDEEGKRSVSFTCKTIPVSGLCHCCSSRAHVLNFIITNLATCRHTEVDICLISCNLDKLNYQKYKKKEKANPLCCVAECDPVLCESDIPTCRDDQILIATRAEGSCCLAHICSQFKKTDHINFSVLWHNI